MTNANGNGANHKVTENDLLQLQQDLSRATAKVATCTGHAIRHEAEHNEAQQALKVATRNANDLQRRLEEATKRFHAQRAVDLGIADDDYLPDSQPTPRAIPPTYSQADANARLDRVESNLNQAGGAIAPEGLVAAPVLGVGSRCRVIGADGPAMIVAEVGASLFARRCIWSDGNGDDNSEWFPVGDLEALPRRKFSELSDDEQTASALAGVGELARWSLPTGELVDGDGASTL